MRTESAGRPGGSALRLLSLELGRARHSAANAFHATDRAGRIRAARLALQAAALCAGLGWAWAYLLQPFSPRSVPVPAPGPAALASAGLLGFLLFLDGVRRGTGRFESERERRFAEEWLRVAGVPASAIAVRGSLRVAAVGLLVSWVVLLPLADAVRAHPPVYGAALLLVGVGLLLAGDGLGQLWRFAPGWVRFVIGAAAALWALYGLAFLSGTAPDAPVWLRSVPRTGAVSWPWGPLVRGEGSPGLAAVLFLGGFAASVAGRRWSVGRMGWAGERGATTLRAAPAGRGPVERSAWRALVHRDLRRVTLWARRDLVVALYTTLPLLGAHVMIARGSRGPSPLFANPAAMPWVLLVALALFTIAYSEGLWFGEARRMWGLYTSALPDPALALRSRLCVGAAGVGGWSLLLSITLLALLGPTPAVLTHLGLGLVMAASATSVVGCAATWALRNDFDATTMGRLLRYAAVLAGLCTPALVYLRAGSLPVAALAGVALAIGCFQLARRNVLRMEFLSVPS